MDHAEVSGLLCIGTRETDGGEESYTAEYPKMDQDTSNATTKFDVVMASSAMYTDHINTNPCIDEYLMSGNQPMEEMRFGSAHPFELPSEVYIYLFIQLNIPVLFTAFFELLVVCLLPGSGS